MSHSASAPWLKFYGQTPATLQYPDQTIYEAIRDTALQFPDKIAYEFMGKQTTYARFGAH